MEMKNMYRKKFKSIQNPLEGRQPLKRNDSFPSSFFVFALSLKKLKFSFYDGAKIKIAFPLIFPHLFCIVSRFTLLPKPIEIYISFAHLTDKKTFFIICARYHFVCSALDWILCAFSSAVQCSSMHALGKEGFVWSGKFSLI